MLSNLTTVVGLAEGVKPGTVLGLVQLDATLLFQILNTVILVALLRHFLFQPVKSIIEKRQQGIVDQLDDAKNKNVDAEKLIDTYNTKLKSVEEEARVMIHEASVKAEKRAQEIIKAAEKDAVLIKERAEKEIEREKVKAVNDLKEEIVSLSLLAASKVLEKDIDQNQHEELITQFLNEVGDTKWQN